MPRKKPPTYIKGAFTHRRTETDYMSTLLDTVTLEDWRDVVTATVAAAKAGEAAARTFLAQYLMGRPDLKAPAPVTVVVQQLAGRDPLVDRLAQRHIQRRESPGLYRGEEWKEAIKAELAEELRGLEVRLANPT